MTLATDYANAVDKSQNMNLASAAIARVAAAVLIESAGVANHTARLQWAQKALPNVQRMAAIMIWGIIGDAGVQSSPTDANILAAVDALAFAYANV